MIDPRTKLTVWHDDNGSFTDLKDAAADFLRDPFAVTMVSAEDRFYIGFRKAIGSVYVEMETPNTNAGSFTAEYWDGLAWQQLSLNDETQGWTRSGFMSWDKTNMESTNVNGVDHYYVRLTPSVDHSATTVRAINIVFSDDNQLKQEFSQITNANLLPPGQSSHIMHHVAARNKIIQELRNKGYLKVNVTTGDENLTPWDLHDLFEVREAATQLALAKIFFELSDGTEDQWWHKYREYKKAYDDAFSLVILSVDTNDDGKEDTSEKRRQAQSVRWTR